MATEKLLLAMDVGNTNTVLGVYAGEKLVADWRLRTAREQTVDEYGILTRDLFRLAGMAHARIEGVVIASVVPPLNTTLAQMSERYFNRTAVFVSPTEPQIMPVLYDNPLEVGADRIANGIAAYAKYGGPCIVVDFGTAINFDVVSRSGEYMGGVLAPGIGIAADALSARAARLFRVEISDPGEIIGTNTARSLQAGFYYGFVGMVDGILERLKTELGARTRIVATGGQAALIAKGSKYIEAVDEHLTLDGLRLYWNQTKSGRGKQKASLRSHKK